MVQAVAVRYTDGMTTPAPAAASRRGSKSGNPAVRKAAAAKRAVTRPRKLVIDAGEQQSITVSLVGVDYEVTPPKAFGNLQMAQLGRSMQANPDEMSEEDVDEFIGVLLRPFTPEDAEAVEARLQDANDLLDVNHLTQLLDMLRELGEDDNPPT